MLVVDVERQIAVLSGRVGIEVVVTRVDRRRDSLLVVGSRDEILRGRAVVVDHDRDGSRGGGARERGGAHEPGESRGHGDPSACATPA